MSISPELNQILPDIYYFMGAPRDQSVEALNYATRLYAVLEDFGSQPQDDVTLLTSTIEQLNQVKSELQTDYQDLAVRDLRGIKLSYIQKRYLLNKRGADLVEDLGDILGLSPYFNRYATKAKRLSKGAY